MDNGFLLSNDDYHSDIIVKVGGVIVLTNGTTRSVAKVVGLSSSTVHKYYEEINEL